MKIIGNIISVLAVFLFLGGLCAINNNTAFAFSSMCASAVWLVAWGYTQEENNRGGS